jgi:hypothetical protein
MDRISPGEFTLEKITGNAEPLIGTNQHRHSPLMRSLFSQFQTPTAPRRAVGFFRSGCPSGCPAWLIMRFGHGSGDGGVARLVRADKAERAQTAEEAYVENHKNKWDSPERDFEGSFFGGARADWGGGIQTVESSIVGRASACRVLNFVAR